ncbi:MAG: SufD family Fe-S cluster assembly protein, partial [Firmicutes bacterium]|nr:SufD family Fe-S cluster assembly protein [Bacillota bacterium]
RIAILSRHKSLQISKSEGHSKVIVEKNESPLFLLLDWSQIELAHLDIEISSCQNVDILEIADARDTELNLLVEEGATLNWATVAFSEGKKAKMNGVLEKNATLNVAVADFSQGNESFDAIIVLKGEHSRIDWHLASLAARTDQKNIQVSFDHIGLDTYAMMNNYGVTEDSGSLIFAGTSHIFKGSHHSRTHQNAKIMVFDPQCIAKANPVLKIDENDIEASHAAAVGKVNDDHLFYLCSRGLKHDEAKRLITLGYLNPIMSYFHDKNIKQQIAEEIEKRV